MTCMWLSAVARNLLVMQANRARDLFGGGHAAALSHAEHLPGAVQQRHSLIHRLRRKGVLGAIDGGHEQR